MDKEQLKRIKLYCERATGGPWTRSFDKARMITSMPDKPVGKRSDICQLPGEDHIQDWFNYQFLANSRTDLPMLADECLDLMKLVELTRQQLELEKANRKLGLGVAKIHIKKAKQSSKEYENERKKLKREKTEKQLQLEMLNRQIELERSIKKLEVERANRQLEMERAQKLELFEQNLDYGSKGPLDNLLNDLDRVENRFKSDHERERAEAGYSESDPVTRARRFIYAANKQREENQQQSDEAQQQNNDNQQQAVEDSAQDKNANVEAMENITDYLPQHEQKPDGGQDEQSDEQQDDQHEQSPTQNAEQADSEASGSVEEVKSELTAKQFEQLQQAVENAEQEVATATEQVAEAVAAADEQAQVNNSSALENFVKSEDQQNEYLESKDDEEEDSLSLDDLIAQLDLTERDFNLRTHVENKIHNKLGDAAAAADEFLHEGHAESDDVSYEDSSESIESAEEAL